MLRLCKRTYRIFQETQGRITTTFHLTDKVRVVKSMDKSSLMTKLLKRTFLPAGYPHSVHSSYLRIHAWQFLETCASSIIICVEATATAAGVAVAANWALKDGIGEIGKLLFVNRYS
jgi:hypothetical protein